MDLTPTEVVEIANIELDSEVTRGLVPAQIEYVKESVIEINDERRRLEERRREDKKLDAMGTRRWKRKGVS